MSRNRQQSSSVEGARRAPRFEPTAVRGAALLLATVAMGSLGCGADGAGSPTAPARGEATSSSARPAVASPTGRPQSSSGAAWTLPDEPARTRAGQLRFVDPELENNPAAARMILDRLANEPREAVRAALVEALPRTGGEWLAAIMARFAAEPAPAVRVAMAALGPRAPRGEGGPLLALGLVDPDPAVRTEAALAAASLPAAAVTESKLAAELERLLADSEPTPRAAAARSLGILELVPSFPAIRPLLRDRDGEVRLQALRALERLEPRRAAGLEELAELERDADARVARLAVRMRASGPR